MGSWDNLRAGASKLATITALSMALAGFAFAQSYLGGIRGTVSDSSGAAIPDVKVTLTNQGTGVARSTISNSTGAFVFSDVDPATYSITAESPSFKKFERSGVIVATQQFLTVDVKMEVGNVSQSVTVTEDVPLVETSNASQGQDIDNQKLVTLPNLGRNPFMMSKLVQNVEPVGNPAYNRMEDQSGSSQISIAGGPVRGNNYLLDGVPITDALNRAIIIPSLEAVEDVKIQANTYDASMARTGGGMFNTLMKSGANEYHGSLYGHIRRTAMDANSYFNNAAGLPITDQPNTTWGASFGGKVWIPKVYDGKNKTFFWIATEHYDDTQSASTVFAAPTALERVGNFSQSYTPSGALDTIYNPLSTTCANGVCTRTPFAGNIIPQSMLNPVGLNIAKTYSMPTTAPLYYGAPDLNASAQLPCRAFQFTAKVDENFTDWWHASVSYARYFSLEPGNTWFNSPSSPDQWRLQRRVDATAVNNIFTIDPTTVVAIRYGFNRFPNFSYQESYGFNVGSLGFSPAYLSSITSPVFPEVGMSSMYPLGTNSNSYYVHASDNVSASVSKYKGRHSLTVGFDYRQIKAAGNDLSDSSGYFAFNGIFTQSNPTSSGVGGADLADMLLGYPQTATGYTSTKLTDFANYYGLYVQDDFRFSDRLTLNLGLRWEREYGLQEANNAMITGFNGSAVNPMFGSVTGIVPSGILEFAGMNGAPVNVGNPNLNKLAPRIGAAYRVNDKTVIRAGYGVFWAPQFAIGAPLPTPGFTAQTNYVASTNGYETPAGTLSNPFPNGWNRPTGTSLGALTGVGQSLSIYDPYAGSPMIQQYSFDIQRQLAGGIAFEIGYVGSMASHLTLGTSAVNMNALNPALLAQGSALLKSVANPFYGHGGTGVIGAPKVQASQLMLPSPLFGAINYLFDDQNSSRYDSLVLKAQKRFSMGLTFLSTLTWERSTDASSGGAGNTLNGGAVGPQDPYNMAAEYSLSNFDTPLRWSSAFSYDLPVGKGKTFLGNSNKWVDGALGGWSINAVTIFQSGFPLNISQTPNYNSSFGYASQRPNATGASPVTSGSLESRLSNYINPAAFSLAPQFTFGNVSRTLPMRGPGQANTDLSMFKTFNIKERVQAQFRCEALNAFNTPLFYGPNTSFGSASFGKITSQANFSRQLQLAIRASF